MSFIKKLVAELVAVTILAVAYIFGVNIAQNLWDNGLEDKFDEKREKWFSKK